MRLTCASASLLLLGTLAADSARAQSLEAGPAIGHSALGLDILEGIHSDGSTVSVSGGPALGGRFAWDFMRFVGYELSYFRQRVTFRTSASEPESWRPNEQRTVGSYATVVHLLSNNVVAYARPPSARLRPFGTVGLDVAAIAQPHLADAEHVSYEVGSGVNVGAGIKVSAGRWPKFDILSGADV